MSFACVPLLLTLAPSLQTEDIAQANGPALRTETLRGGDGVELTLEWGELEVPERRDVVDGPRLALAYLRVRSRLEQPGPAVFVLAGGPGGSAITKVRRNLEGGGAWYVDLLGGDVVALDQRGVGRSEPKLETPALFELPPGEPGDEDVLLARIREVCRADATRWRERGVDLAGYTTVESADDLEALRRVLGYEAITLWGESYGTHLALATIRRHGAHVARALLMGPEGPDHTFKLPSAAQEGLERIAELVAADPEASERVPDLLAALEFVLEDLEREPLVVDVDGVEVGISKFDVQLELAFRIGTLRGSGDTIPALVQRMADGDFDELAWAVLEFRRTFGIWSAMNMVMDCSSGASSQRRARIEAEAKTTLLGNALNFPTMHLAQAWGAPDLGDAFRARLRSDVPILFIVGDVDSRTPIRNAEELMVDLPNARLLVVENAGHGDVPWLQPDLREAWSGFLKGDEETIDTVAAPRPRFVLP